MKRAIITITIGALIGVALVVAYVLTSGDARSHDFYDAACCSERDCHPALEGAVRPVSTGYLITRTREIIPYPQARVSPDGEYHTCENPTGRTICLYAPPMGF